MRRSRLRAPPAECAGDRRLVSACWRKGSSAFRASACHEQSDIVFVGPPLWEVRQDSPFEHDQYPVRQPEDFAQFRRDKKNRAASVALGDELLVDIIGRADVQSSRRLLPT